MLAGTLVYPPGLWDFVVFCLVSWIPRLGSLLLDASSSLAFRASAATLGASMIVHLYIILRPVHGRARFRIAEEPTIREICASLRVCTVVETSCLSMRVRGHVGGHISVLPPERQNMGPRPEPAGPKPESDFGFACWRFFCRCVHCWC